MRYNHVIFDLDGTLLNTLPGITATLEHTLAQHGYTGEYDKSIIVGPPLTQVLRTAGGFTGKQLDDAVATYRRYYERRGQFMAQPYDGIADLLRSLAERGARCYVATSKLETAARSMLDHFSLSAYITDVSGATPDFSRGDKPSVLRHLLQNNPIDKQSAVMVGDRNLDLIGARAVGIDAIGAAYGFAPSTDELYAERPVAVAANVPALSRLLLEDA